MAIGQYVLKVHGRCDLSCDHCYVYEHADQSWLTKPTRIGADVVVKAADRIAEHAVAQGQREVVVVLHGGEPLLLGVPGMRAVLAALRSRLDRVVGLDLRVQTNGLRLDEVFCALFAEYRVKVGISLDGDRVANDRHRRYRDGRSSYDGVLRALRLLREWPHLYAGILCTIDVANDPIAVYEALLAEEPPVLDLLLPHATWETPPPRPASVPAPYADWLARIYTRWVADGRPVPIRLFDSILSAARGGASWTEAIGLEPVDLLVIETDGGYEQADSVKVAFAGAPGTGMTVFTHSVDQAAAHPGVAARAGGRDDLCAVCRSCEVVAVCGGGLYAHRYRAGAGFDNPSVFCADLKALIRHIAPADEPGADVHWLAGTSLDSLAAGPGSPEAVAELAECQLSVTRALVAEVAAAMVEPGWAHAGDRELARVAAAGWTLLCELDEIRPDAVRAVLAHPFARAWAMHCLRPPAAGALEDLNRAHFAGFAAAVAARAGISAELALPVREGRVYLPALGAIEVGETGRSALVRIRPGSITTEPRGTWRAVRSVTAEDLRLAVEDLDPFRDCGTWRPADRLNEQDWRLWRGTLMAGLRALRSEVPDYARSLAVCLRAIVPVAGWGRRRDAFSPDAYGAVAVGPTPEVHCVGELLIGAFQRAKLNALTESIDLCRPGEVLHVPWSDRPRLADDVFHDAYVALALAELWRSRGSADRYRRHRDRLATATEALLGSGTLTAGGTRFAGGMAANAG